MPRNRWVFSDNQMTPLKRNSTCRGKCIFLLGAVRWPKQEFQKAFSWFLRSVPIPGTKQVFAFSPADTQALRKCFHKVSCPLWNLLGTFFWLLTLKCMQTFICGVCRGICHLPSLKEGDPDQESSLKTLVSGSFSRSALAA